MKSEAPKRIHYDREHHVLAIEWTDYSAELPAELLRVFSPSADVRGHGNEPRSFPSGKRYVEIEAIEPAGRYAIQIRFSDGHDTGIYQWSYLRELAHDQTALQEDYERHLHLNNETREPNTSVIKFHGG